MKKITFNLPQKIFGLEIDFLKYFWVFVVLFLVFILSFKFVILPKVGEIISITNQISAKDKELKATREKLNYLVSLDKNELNKNADYFNSALLKEKNSYILVNIVKAVADKFGYQIRSFSVTPGEVKIAKDSKANIVSKLPISLVVVGPREKYLDFISALEKNLPILTIDEFNLTTVENLSQIDLTVSAYYVQGAMETTLANFSLSDLTLTKEESSVLQNISGFQKNTGTTESQPTRGFVKYTRENPFSL